MAGGLVFVKTSSSARLEVERFLGLVVCGTEGSVFVKVGVGVLVGSVEFRTKAKRGLGITSNTKE